MNAPKQAKENKQGWSNKEWDSTGFLIGMLGLFGFYLYMIATNSGFRDSEAATQLLIIFSAVFSGMRDFFFKKSGNGDHPPHPEDGGNRTS